MTLQYGELRPTSGWDRFISLGQPSKFQRVSRLGFVTAAMSLNGRQPNFARCLAVSCAATLYIHFGGCCPVTEFCQVQNSVCVLQVLCSPIGSVTARHSSSGREPNFAALSTGRHLFGRATITLGIGPHSSFVCFRAICQLYLHVWMVTFEWNDLWPGYVAW